MTADFRLGRWQDVLGDVECDAAIFDAPYGERVHRGHNAGISRRKLATGAKPLDYNFLTAKDVGEIVDHWSPRTSGWICTITSHDLIPHWESYLEGCGRYVFPPLPILDRGMSARRAGDGPASWTVFMVVARPRNAQACKWGALPGWYERESNDKRPRSIDGRMGGKPLGLMRAIVRDYSRPGDLVCDPFGGHATTLLAALREGRRAVGAEVDPGAHAAGCSRLADAPTIPARDGTPCSDRGRLRPCPPSRSSLSYPAPRCQPSRQSGP